VGYTISRIKTVVKNYKPYSPRCKRGEGSASHLDIDNMKRAMRDILPHRSMIGMASSIWQLKNKL